MKTVHIGIDPGVKTGYAAWDCATRKFASVQTLQIHQAMEYVLQHHRAGTLAMVSFEDARQRTWFGGADSRQQKYGAGIREGVGSVKRDCSIWADFLDFHMIDFLAVKPQAGATKWDAETFKRITGWTERTSEHARDAGLLVFGK